MIFPDKVLITIFKIGIITALALTMFIFLLQPLIAIFVVGAVHPFFRAVRHGLFVRTIALLEVRSRVNGSPSST